MTGPSFEPRFFFLELIREFASEKLVESGEHDRAFAEGRGLSLEAAVEAARAS